MNDIIVSIIPIVLTIGVVSLSFTLFLLAVHDFIVARHSVKLKESILPDITVIVLSTGRREEINSCLMSMKKIRYRKLDAIVVGASGHRSELSQVKKIVRKYAHVRYYQPRKEHTHSKLIQEAYKRSERGSIVIVIDSFMLVNRAILDDLDRSSNIIESGKIIRLQPTSNDYGLAGVIMSIRGSAHRMFIKLCSVLHVPVPAARRLGGYILASSHLGVSARKPSTWKYSDFRTITTSSSRLSMAGMFGASIKVVGRLIGFVGIVVVAFAMVQAAIEGSGLEALTISWLLVATAAALLVLFDTDTNWRQKIETVACFGFIPIMVLIAYVTTVKYDTSS